MPDIDNFCYRMELTSLDHPFVAKVFQSEDCVYELRYVDQTDWKFNSQYIMTDLSRDQIVGVGNLQSKGIGKYVVEFELTTEHRASRATCSFFSFYCTLDFQQAKYKIKYTAFKQRLGSTSITITRKFRLFSYGPLTVCGLTSDLDVPGNLLLVGLLYPLYVNLPRGDAA